MAMSVTYTTIDGEIIYENRGGVQSFYVPDMLGSTVALTFPTGTVTDTYAYWPFGEIRNHVGTSQTPFTYGGTLGYFLDLLNNFLYIRARYLRPALARWQTVDPIGLFGYPYNYAGNSPVLQVDPEGLIPPLPVGKHCEAWRKYLPGLLQRCLSRPADNSVCFATWNNLSCAYTEQCLGRPCPGKGRGGGGSPGGGGGSSCPDKPGCPSGGDDIGGKCGEMCLDAIASPYYPSEFGGACLVCCRSLYNDASKYQGCVVSCATIAGLGWAPPAAALPCDCAKRT
jgi:RHS repeat-associated protein